MVTNTALIVQEPGTAIAQSCTVPALRSNYVIVRVKAVALNPTDWKHIDRWTTAGARIGCDFSGIIEAVGSNVNQALLKPGDRVLGVAHGGNEVNHEDGSFARYITSKDSVTLRMPDHMSFEEAATFGVGITTVGMALYQSLQLPWFSEPALKPFPILIYGASTATGAIAIQYARLSGLDVIAVCSSRNFEYVKSLGATTVFDYNSPTCAADIKAYTNGNIQHALDCVSEGDSVRLTIESMNSDSGIYCNILNLEREETTDLYNPRIQAKWVLGYTAVGEYFVLDDHEYAAKPEDEVFARDLWRRSSHLLENRSVRAHRHAVNKYGCGFDGILAGLDAMRHGKISGEKLVYTL